MTAAQEMMSAVQSITIDEARAHAVDVVKKSGTSFASGMRILKGARREAMYAIYAFCREVDDIADEDAPLDEKRRQLADWRDEIEALYRGAPTRATSIALVEHIGAFDLPKDEFILVIEGMEIDAKGPVVAPSYDELFHYTRRAAGAVGMLSMPVFGAPKSKAAEEFALSLGDALQLTNILRDVEEDAGEGRIYLPRELLVKHGCTTDPEIITTDSGLPAVRAALAEIARSKFSDARAALAKLDWRQLRPALLMMGVYERYLEKMLARGWENGQQKIALSKVEKAAIAMRWYFAPKRG